MANAADFVQYLESTVDLDDLQRLTTGLDDQLRHSQEAMNEINALKKLSEGSRQISVNSELLQEDILDFLKAEPSNLLLPDMEPNCNSDIEDIMTELKGYLSSLQKNTISLSHTILPKQKLQNLELDSYSISLDQLCKHLSNIKLKCIPEDKRNKELEEKLAQLCTDVNMFNQLIETKTTLSKLNMKWADTKQIGESALQYDDIISKLLSRINEVSYLLQNIN